MKIGHIWCNGCKNMLPSPLPSPPLLSPSLAMSPSRYLVIFMCIRACHPPITISCYYHVCACMPSHLSMGHSAGHMFYYNGGQAEQTWTGIPVATTQGEQSYIKGNTKYMAVAVQVIVVVVFRSLWFLIFRFFLIYFLSFVVIAAIQHASIVKPLKVYQHTFTPPGHPACSQDRRWTRQYVFLPSVRQDKTPHTQLCVFPLNIIRVSTAHCKGKERRRRRGGGALLRCAHTEWQKGHSICDATMIWGTIWLREAEHQQWINST